MINRQNWLDAREFCKYYENQGRNPESVKKVWGILRHMLEWADEKPLAGARSFDPSFQIYLLTARTDGKPIQLSAASMKKACEYVRWFFRWVHWEKAARFRGITEGWVETIRPVPSKGLRSEFHEHQFWDLEQVRVIAKLVPGNITEERDQAAVCFLFLSAMRAQAFVSLPVGAVNLAGRMVSQFPSLGVATKKGVAARTQLARIPDLMAVVERWDAKVREANCRLWYPRIDRWHRFMGKETEGTWLTRTEILRKGIRRLCTRAGIPYLSSHKLRHGHIVYVMKRVRDMEGLKALSQNMMHSSVAITDGIYGRLVSDDVRDMYDDIAEDDTPTGARRA